MVIGLDEVGRGCLAGPVYVGGTVFTPEIAETVQTLKIHDSKLLIAKKRAILVPKIHELAAFHHVESSSCDEINKNGIVAAITSAFQRVVQFFSKTLTQKKTGKPKIVVFLDGRPLAGLNDHDRYTQIPIIKGDRTSISIAAASILAKEARDEHMRRLAQDYPQYGWETNVGYATKIHTQALKQHGPSQQHRTLFIRNSLKI